MFLQFSFFVQKLELCIDWLICVPKARTLLESCEIRCLIYVCCWVLADHGNGSACVMKKFDFICIETANCMQVYLKCLHVSKCIFMYLSDRGAKIQKDTFRYVVSKCIFLTRVQRYKKIHLVTWYLNVSF